MSKKVFIFTTLDLSDEDFLEYIGKYNYDLYCRSTGGVSLISGDKLPEFKDLKPKIQQAWKDAAKGLLDNFMEE